MLIATNVGGLPLIHPHEGFKDCCRESLAVESLNERLAASTNCCQCGQILQVETMPACEDKFGAFLARGTEVDPDTVVRVIVDGLVVHSLVDVDDSYVHQACGCDDVQVPRYLKRLMGDLGITIKDEEFSQAGRNISQLEQDVIKHYPVTSTEKSMPDSAGFLVVGRGVLLEIRIAA